MTSAARRTDSASLEIHASPDALYAAFADGSTLMQWLPPDTMTGRALEYDFREGGRYCIELRYPEAENDEHAGKTSAQTDVSRGRFVTLEPGRRIVQVGEFEAQDDGFGGEMRLTWSFEAVGALPDGGRPVTRVTVTANDVPPGIPEADHLAGLRSSLENLAKRFG